MDDTVPLVRDVLDKQIFDANGEKLGKVDGIVLSLRANRPPRVTAIEMDVKIAWRRIHPACARWIERVQQWLHADAVAATRIRFEQVVRTGIDVHVDVDGRRTNAYVWEIWLKRRFVDRIPGGKREVK